MFRGEGKAVYLSGTKILGVQPPGKIIGAIKQANTFAGMKYTVNFEGRVRRPLVLLC